jgi:lysophospholipid acyltransferase (LPLAT)-like uncharacterized protein
MPATAVKKSSGVVVPNRPKWHQRLAAGVVWAAIRMVSMTLRYSWIDRSGFFDGTPPGPAIYCVWHNRLALCMIAYFGYVKQRNRTKGLAAMVSASRDGGFLTGVLECFGVEPVRGSTSRRGPQALLELTNWARKGYDLAITPDGPRGPCYVVQEGIIALAQLTGRPVVPVSYHLGWKVRPKSWDRFQIPLPFSRCEIYYGKPAYVPREITPAERETYRLRLENALKSISRD